MKIRIHVYQHNIKANRKQDKKVPVFTVKTYNSNTYGNSIGIQGPCKLVYSPDTPLSCGATVWIETNSNVEIVK